MHCSYGYVQGFWLYCLWFTCCKTSCYALSENAAFWVYLFLKPRKQSVKLNDTESVFQILLLGVPQGFILGPTLLYIFINK